MQKTRERMGTVELQLGNKRQTTNIHVQYKNNSKSQEYINNTSITPDCLDAGTRYFILDKKIAGSFWIQAQVHFFYTLSLHPKP